MEPSPLRCSRAADCDQVHGALHTRVASANLDDTLLLTHARARRSPVEGVQHSLSPEAPQLDLCMKNDGSPTLLHRSLGPGGPDQA